MCQWYSASQKEPRKYLMVKCVGGSCSMMTKQVFKLLMASGSKSRKLEPCFRLSPAPHVQPPAPPSGSYIGVVGAPVSETLTTAGVLSTTPVPSTSPQPASSQPQCYTPPQLQTPPVTPDTLDVPNGGNMFFWPTASSSSWSIPDSKQLQQWIKHCVLQCT